MVKKNAEPPLDRRFYYPFVTLPLYKSYFLGLNMIVADKTLTDSVLSVTPFFVSNKTAPEVYEKAPFRVQVKIIHFTIRLTT